jgi:hypothetical protein
MIDTTIKEMLPQRKRTDYPIDYSTNEGRKFIAMRDNHAGFNTCLELIEKKLEDIYRAGYEARDREVRVKADGLKQTPESWFDAQMVDVVDSYNQALTDLLTNLTTK